MLKDIKYREKLTFLDLIFMNYIEKSLFENGCITEV